MSGLIGWIAVEQYPPPKREYPAKMLPIEAKEVSGGMPNFSQDVWTQMQRHFYKIHKKQTVKPNRLEGV